VELWDLNPRPLACHATLARVWASLGEAEMAVDLLEFGLKESARLSERWHGGYQNCPQIS
jgi:hypothetical protein